MWNRIRNWFARGLAKIGLIQELNELKDHRKIEIDSEAYNRIEVNKQIYAGYVPEWHDVEYRTSDGKAHTRKTLSMNMGKVVANEMSSLIFNEKVNIDVATIGIEQDPMAETPKQDDAKDFITEVLRENDFYEDFQRYLEYSYALGGMAVKVYTHGKKVKLAYAAASSFYPLSYDNGKINEALFVNAEQKNGKHYTLLEWNEWQGDVYVITNELYESATANKLGTKVPLGTIYEDLEEVTRISGLRRPLFVYFKPNTANNKNLDSPLGVSLFENSHDTLRLLDFLYDTFMNEYQLGMRRIAVDSSMIKPFPAFDGETLMKFDPNETVFKALNMEGSGVTDLSVPLRADDFVTGINMVLEVLAMQVGFSSGSFTFDGKSMKTATEIVSENSKTYRTKNSHETLVEKGIKELITTIIDCAKLAKIYSGSTDLEVALDFDDSIAESRDENYKYYANGVGAKLIPRKVAIQRIYKVTEKEAGEWIDEINQDNPQPSWNEEMSDLIGISATQVGE